jgi:hypothetical protein
MILTETGTGRSKVTEIKFRSPEHCSGDYVAPLIDDWSHDRRLYQKEYRHG